MQIQDKMYAFEASEKFYNVASLLQSCSFDKGR